LSSSELVLDDEGVREVDYLLEADGIRAAYGGGSDVIFDVQIKVPRGKIIGLLGANGAGKSTTLRALAGVLPLTAGAVRFDGEPTKASLYWRTKHGMAFLPEGRSIFQSLSCRDNLRVGLADLDAALSVFPELRQLLNIRAGLLSGGEQQMLVLGRALSMAPKLLMIDELSLGLAPLVVRRLFQELREAAERGAGVLVVEQHVRQLLAVSDYSYVMRRGQIVMQGPSKELLENIEEVEKAYLSEVGSGETTEAGSARLDGLDNIDTDLVN
jgi:branched-chain amino acid transport system ATP-binding protein